MLILDSVQQISERKLIIPFFLRSSLSLKTNTLVHVSHLRREDNDHPELVISPIGFHQWPFSFRITATFINEAGIVNELLKTVASYGVNVLMHESGSSLSRSYHDVEMIVDMSRCTDELGDDVDTRAVALERLLTYQFVEKLMFLDAAAPRLHVRPMNGLRHCYEQATHGRAALPRGQYESLVIQREKEPPASKKTRRLFIELSTPMHDRLLKDTKARVGDELNLLQCAMICDTRDRLLRAIYLPARSKPILVSVYHRDEVGALAAITEVLKTEFDILHCLTRPQSEEGNIFEAVLLPLQPALDREWEALVKSMIENSVDLRALRPKVDSPESMGSKANEEYTVAYSKGGHGEEFTPPQKKRVGMDDMLMELESQHKRVRLDPSTLNHDISKVERDIRTWRLAYVNDQISQVKGLKTVFASYRFQDLAMQTAVRSVVQNYRGYAVMTGKDEDHGDCLWANIHRKMGQCKYILSIWTANAKGQVENPDWLLWELGVACSMNKARRIVADERIIRSKRFEKFFDKTRYYTFRHEQPLGGSNSKSSFELAVESAVRDLLEWH